jgi:hypothetical protein
MVLHKGRRLASGAIEELKRGTGAVFECRVKGDQRAFTHELAALGCRCAANDDGVLRISMGDGLGSQTLLRVARDHHVQIRHLVPLRQSLEDVFLQVIGETNAHS